MSSALNTLTNLREETKAIFSIILRKGPLTKSDIQVITKMKLSTLNRIMQPLEHGGFIIESSIGKSTGGRKPVLYDVNAKGYYLIGIDVSRTYTKMVVTNLKTQILYKKQIPMAQSNTPDDIIHLISKFIDHAMLKLSITKDMIIGIGIGTVGPLDRKKGIILNPINFLAPGWNDVPIKEMLQNNIHLPVTIDNGVNTAILAEYMYGAGRNCRNIAYINCGIGIRTGAVSSGSIVRTINNVEDAFGHMVIDVDGELCNCGNYGCIECYSSIPSIVNKFISELKKGRTTIIKKPLEELDYVDICSAAENNDELAKEIIISAATILGVGLSNYLNLLSPQIVILSGPLIEHSNLFFDTCTHVALKKCYLKNEGTIQFSKGGSFQDNAIAVGAAVSILEEVLPAQFDWSVNK